jgi:hypothetical protein
MSFSRGHFHEFINDPFQLEGASRWDNHARPDADFGWLRDARTGDVRGFLNHPELGDREIDLIFVTRKSGVRHIDDDHPGTLDSLPDQWPSLAVDREGPTRTYMENSKIRAVIPKNFEGDPKDWLFTVYPKTESRPGGKLIDSATAEGRAAPFPDRSAEPNISAFLPAGNAPPWAKLGAVQSRSTCRVATLVAR